MVLPDSHGVSRVPRYSGYCCASFSFMYEAFTLYGQVSQLVPLPAEVTYAVLQPRLDESNRFGLIPFRSPLLWESLLISLPPVTEMFHFTGFASLSLCIQQKDDWTTPAGFPHSEISGS